MIFLNRGTKCRRDAVAPAFLLLFFFCLTLFFSPAELHSQANTIGVITKPTNNIGLVSYWPFDEGTGTTVGDETGNGNDLTLVGGSTWGNGKFETAGYFDDVDGSASSTSPYTEVDGSSELTICSWVYLNTLGSTGGTADGSIIGKGSGGDILFWYNIDADGTNDRTYSFSVGVTGNATDRVNGTIGVAVAGAWQYVCGVMNGGTRALYVDGVLNATSTGAVSTIVPSSSYGVLLGGWVNSSNFHLNGRLDEVRVYSRALGASEIARLYQFGQVRLGVSPALVTQGLVGWWTFDNTTMDWTTGSSTDSSGNNNTGKVNGIGEVRLSQAVGVTGQALTFDGIDDYVEVVAGDNSAFDPATSHFTIAFWMKADVNQNSGSNYMINADGNDFYYVYFNSSKQIIFDFDTGETQTLTTSSSYNDGEWHHVVALRNGARTGALYVDGVLVASDTDNSGTLSSIEITSNLFFGQFYTGGGFYKGILDDVRYYTRALTEDEIMLLYNGTKRSVVTSVTPPTPDNLQQGLIGHWTFDGSTVDWSAGSVSDQSGAGQNGTLTDIIATPGKVGQGFSFNGTTSQVNFGSDTSFDNLEELSVAMWVKPKSLRLETYSPRLIDKRDLGWTIWRDETDSAVEFFVDFSSADLRAESPANSFPLHEWIHVVVAYASSTSASSVDFYINGESVATTATQDGAGDRIDDSPYDLRLGECGGSNVCGFNADMDDVRLYNRILTPDEVRSIYQLGG
ncbi:MAG: LamG domain-containing protein [Candidatus Paceibacterota bacterium]